MNINKEYSNVPNFVLEKLDMNIYKLKNHPLEIIKQKILTYFKSKYSDWSYFEDLPKYVNIEDNFDKLLIPSNHPSRSKSDTYYINENQVLRTHTTAHQNKLLEEGYDNFLICGDVYRKDEVDSCHYYVFHQFEGVRLYDINDDVDMSKELVDLLSGLCEVLFPNCEIRVKPDYFPFTNPSFEIEVKYNDKWLEILGCGIIQPKILDNCNRSNKKGIAWGLGLERLAMILFDIPDIRYFWMNDPKFLSQFSTGNITKFIPFSPLDSINKDVSMFVKSDDMVDNKWIKENDIYQEILSLTNDWVEKITIIDSFYNKKLDKHSICLRITYSPKDYKITNPSEFNEIVNTIQNNLVVNLKNIEWIEIRG